jgi:hypothetical protein
VYERLRHLDLLERQEFNPSLARNFKDRLNILLVQQLAVSQRLSQNTRIIAAAKATV